MNKDGHLYANTRYYLSNKFQNPDKSGDANGGNRDVQCNIKETGNIYNLDEQEIPDILTG